MRQLRALFARITGLFAGPTADADVREELEAHLEMEIAENVRRGMTPADARVAALRASGGLMQATEAVHEQRGLPWVESIAGDVRYALRALRRVPGFSAIVVVTLALGIGANTAIFSVVRGVLLKPLPHRDGDRLLYLRHSIEVRDQSVQFSVPEVREIRTAARSFSGLAEYSPWGATLEERNTATSLNLALVTGNYFDVMGLSPVIGRVTQPTDDGAGVPPVLVLTHEFWMKHFGGDPSIVGRQVVLNGTPVTVIGVVQAAPWYPDRIDALANMVLSPHHLSATMVEGRSHRMTEIVARLAPNASIESARTEVASIYARMQRDHPDAYDSTSRYRVDLMLFRDAIGQRAKLTVWIFMAAAAFVMIISAANVANLTLMRGVRRGQELVVRAALGAGTGRLRRLLLTENLVLAVMGALGGIAIARGGVTLLVSFIERFSPRASDIRLDTVVLGFTLALAVGLAIVLSMIAALPREGSFAARIAAGVQRMSGSASKLRLQRALVVAQIAVSVVLLAGAGLLTRTMLQLSEVDTGLRTDEVLTIPVQLFNPAKLNEISPQMIFGIMSKYEQMRREIAELPGVREVALGSTMPLRRSRIGFDLSIEGRPLATGQVTPHADLRTASPSYFRAAGIPLLAGRAFELTDRVGSAPVVIINRTAAERFFPGENPIGRRIAWNDDVLQFTPVSGNWRTVVGVVGNTQDGGLDAKPRAAVFEPFAQEFPMGGGLIIRADSNVAALATPATKVVRRIAPTVPLDNVLTVTQIKELSVAPRRLNAALVSSFGILALIIAAVGIAGVLAFSVSARTNEIGIRMSLGADRARVQRMILGEGGVLLAGGLALGIAGAYFASRAIRELLFGVAPHDPVTFGVVTLLMALIGALACWIPALRASRIDPAIAMRAT